MSTYTESLGLELITPGSQAGLWGNTTNNTFTLIDQAITGVTPLSFASASGTTQTLTDYNGAEDQARSAVLNITGSATGPNTVVIPNKQKTYLVRNNTGQDVTFQTPSPSATYAVGAGYSILIFCDGNNNVFTGIASPSVGTISVNAGGTGATTFTAGFIKSTGGTSALTSSATVNMASEVTGTLAVANGGTGVTSFTSGGVVLGNGTGALSTVTASTVGYVLTWNGSTWQPQAPTSGGVTSISGTSPIVVTGSTTPTISLGTVPIANGGTGATSASAALSNLGGVSSSALSAYGALSGTNSWSGANTFTTPISVNLIISGTSNQTYIDGNSTNINLSIGNATKLNINSSGNLTITGDTAVKSTGTTWANPSDQRLKDNVQPYTNGLAELSQVNPKTWVFNGKGGSKAGEKGVGVIADEIQQVLPNTVTTYRAKLDEADETETDIKRFDASEIIWTLVNAVKELKAEVDALKAAK